MLQIVILGVRQIALLHYGDGFDELPYPENVQG
jgi:hypothetical protein